MTGPDDDLTRWGDDPLVRALREPGTADELAGEADYLAAFRAAQPPAAATPISSGRLRRAGRRLGGGGTAVVVAVALGAGAAAAYTQNLPEPVQRAVHGVLGPVGVPGPSPRPDRPAADQSREESGPTGADDDAPADGTDDPTASPTDEPDGSPSGSPSDDPAQSPGESATPSTTDSPTEPPPPVTAPPAAVSVVGSARRAAPQAQVALSGTVTAADGSVVAGEEVVLLQRRGRTWQPVGSTTSDASGAVSVATPALTRTSVFRLGVGSGLTSPRWRVVLVPELSTVASPTSEGTSIAVAARGARPGDVVTLQRRRDGASVLVARSRLGDDLSTTFRVAAPDRPVRYVARLLRTRAHAVARDALRVRPARPRTLSATAPVDVLGPADQVTVTGTVRGDQGVALPGRTVRLLLRTPGGDWRRVGTAVSDASGGASFSVGPLGSTTAVRLRVGAVRSPVVRLRLRPAWTASVAREDRGSVITGTATGGDVGDQVLLRTVVDGRLVTVQQATLGPASSVRFVVQPSDRRQRYRLVLLRTPLHLRAVGAVVVRAASPG